MRDLYIPAGDTGLWQGALRERSDASHGEVTRAIEAGEPVSIELLYSDQVGGQRTISRFNLVPLAPEGSEETGWLLRVRRHWYLDGVGPR